MLSASGISKAFGATQALDDVSIRLEPGEIHGLIGENGAGKSTLVKTLCGVHRPDAGTIEVGGESITGWSPEIAIASGLITVHQDVNLIETMTVTENIFLNAEIKRGPFLDRQAMAAEAQQLLDTLMLEISPEAVLGSLPTDLRKMVQLARAMRQKPRVLLLDEPTSSLTADEVDILISQVKSIAATGVSVLYISHYLNEVFEHTQSLTILRDGKTAWQGATSDITLPEAIRTMIGGTLRTSQKIDASTKQLGEPVLKLRNLTLGHRLSDISFDVRPGEILGIGGLIGAGLGDLARTIFADPDYRATSGDIMMDGERVDWTSPADAMGAGIGLVTNDRHRSGAIVDFSIADNIGLPSLSRFSNKFGVLKTTALKAEVDDQMQQLSVKAAGPLAALSTLSGGNQQKVMLAKWFMTNPRVLILDEPTIGVDIGAKQSIKDLILQKAAEGCAVVILSSEMDEIVEVADRALILFRGRIVARLDEPGFTQEDLTNAANASFNPKISTQTTEKSVETIS
ncbi:sugar ABC transporter ATP-binding protein [Pacificibacter marinus]|uniref:sugar ABC transporter ATP-binding protein n=1 Tax=Pacificibacter marinus TaxID=658057 RepID=UPI0020915AE7|nr:sugar ABC transporter ATP-binding protein [Pacificibacter marinus]